MSDLVLCIATREWTGWRDCVHSWHAHAKPRSLSECIVSGKTIMPAYRECYERTSEPILAYIHDDVFIYEHDWDLRVLRQFDDPSVGMVGFAGAMGHGVSNLHKAPFHPANLTRHDFLSNMRGWRKHGGRFTGARNVAVLDGFAIFVRRSILDKARGWPVDSPLGYYLYCEWLCCETRRQGLRIRLVGVDCHHLGGQTSGSAQVQDDFEKAHRYLYEHYRDVLPCRVL
jgi:hypothetical protein